jgi:transcriptional regulator with XRE-family HTH domain
MAIEIHNGTMQGLGRFIQNRRTDMGMRSETLASLIDRSQSWVSRLETGTAKTLPEPNDLTAIASALGVSVFDLLEAAGYVDGVRPDPNDAPIGLLVEPMEMGVIRCLQVDLANVPDDAAAVVQERARQLGHPSAVKHREKLERQRAGLVEQVQRAEQLVTSGRRDFVWFDAFDADAQERIAAIDAELATLSAIPSQQDIEHRIAEIARLGPMLPLLPASSSAARKFVSALGHVVFAGGAIRMEYAPEYRDLFPTPHRVTAHHLRTPYRWEIRDCC